MDAKTSNRRRPHRVAMYAYPDAQILDATGPLEVFSRTARWLAERGEPNAYEVFVVGPAAGPIAMSSGLELIARHGLDDHPPPDTLLVSGGIGFRKACEDEALLDWLKAQEKKVARLGSICTGSFILGAAGLLDGKRATTHWAYLDDLERCIPSCAVDRSAIYVRSGRVYSSAGVTAGIDLALALVEEDRGRATALAVAQELVVYRRRTASQAQISRFLEAEKRTDRIGSLQVWMLDHLGADLSVEALAARAGLSTRHFARRFKGETGVAPAGYVSRIRAEEARRRIEAGARPKQAAAECGFKSEQSLRRALRRTQAGCAPKSG